MLKYPAWFTALDRERIDEAVREASPPLHVNGAGTNVVIFGSRYPTETAAVDAVIAVFEVVVQTLRTRRSGVQLARVRRASETLLDDLIVWANRYQSDVSLDAFAASVRGTLETQAWWKGFIVTLRKDQKALALAATAEQLKALRAEAHWTVDELAEALDIGRTSVQDHLLGRSRPKAKTLSKYVKVFSDRLGHPVKIS